MKRLYQQLVEEHLEDFRQMIFLAGPRQVGKTTTSLSVKRKKKKIFYFNWDNQPHRNLIISGPDKVAAEIKLEEAKQGKVIIIFNEIHKYGKWKQFLKGFFDVYAAECKIIVTGSAKLDVFKAGGDSLMGRYFLYRVHPLTIAEILHTNIPIKEVRLPKRISNAKISQLLEFGGFPEPFLTNNKRFYSNWKRLRQQQLIEEDIRQLSQIHELAQLEMLSSVLKSQVGQLLNYNNLANLINVSAPTVRRWLQCLESFYYCFSIKPWTKNVKRTLKKDPKYYLWDWSMPTEKGARLENFVASHLLKAVHFWTDYGLGEYDLFFLRDKEKREVDFLVVKDSQPWFIVEVKSKDSGVSKALYHFQEQTKAKHAFQVVFDKEYIDKNCFSYTRPVVVPVSTFLSQLI